MDARTFFCLYRQAPTRLNLTDADVSFTRLFTLQVVDDNKRRRATLKRLSTLGAGFQLPGISPSPNAADIESEPDTPDTAVDAYDPTSEADQGQTETEAQGTTVGMKTEAGWRPPPPPRETHNDALVDGDQSEEEDDTVGELPDSPAATAQKDTARHGSLAQVELTEARALETWHWIDDDEMVFKPAKLVPAKLAGPPK